MLVPGLERRLVDKGLVTSSITLHVGYSPRSGRKSAHGTTAMTLTTSSARAIISCALNLYEQIVDQYTPVHRVNLSFNHVMDELYQQYDLFTDPAALTDICQLWNGNTSSRKSCLTLRKSMGKMLF